MSKQTACGSEEIKFPLSRFPLRGKAGAGGFPPRRDTCRCQQTTLAHPVLRLPPQEGCAPLCIPRWATAPLKCFRLSMEFNFALAETIAAG
jgi:hypothetical protein